MQTGPLLALALCSASTSSDLRPTPPPSLTAPCAAPVKLPEDGLSQSQVEILWGRDRRALRSCAGAHEALVRDWLSI